MNHVPLHECDPYGEYATSTSQSAWLRRANLAPRLCKVDDATKSAEGVPSLLTAEQSLETPKAPAFFGQKLQVYHSSQQAAC